METKLRFGWLIVGLLGCTFAPNGTGADVGVDTMAADGGAPSMRDGATQNQSLEQVGRVAIAAAGSNVALAGDGNTLAVSDLQEDGRVTIYARHGANDWQMAAQISVRPGATPLLGLEIALSHDGSRLAIGEVRGRFGRGAAAVYTRGQTAGEWHEELLVVPSREPSELGSSVSISGDGLVFAVGDPSNDRGSVAVYRWESAAWQRFSEPSTRLLRNAPQTFGTSIALNNDGSTMVVGDPSARGFHGAVTVFQRSGDAWTSEELPPTDAHQTFGAKVAMSGDGLRLAVSDPDGDATSGAVSIFSKTRGGWTGTQVRATNPYDFGHALAISGDGRVLVVADPRNQSGQPGAVSVFMLSLDGSPLRSFDLARPPGIVNGFGERVAMSDDGATVVVTAGMSVLIYGR